MYIMIILAFIIIIFFFNFNFRFYICYNNVIYFNELDYLIQLSLPSSYFVKDYNLN